MRAKRVGSSVVSAITQTPASGPFELVTTPPMSSESIATAPGFCWASTQTNEAVISKATNRREARLKGVRGFMAGDSTANGSSPTIIAGGRGNDTIVGANGWDELRRGADSDTLDGRGGVRQGRRGTGAT